MRSRGLCLERIDMAVPTLFFSGFPFAGWGCFLEEVSPPCHDSTLFLENACRRHGGAWCPRRRIGRSIASRREKRPDPAVSRAVVFQNADRAATRPARLRPRVE